MDPAKPSAPSDVEHDAKLGLIRLPLLIDTHQTLYALAIIAGLDTHDAAVLIAARRQIEIYVRRNYGDVVWRTLHR